MASERVQVAFAMERRDYEDLKAAADEARMTVSGYLRNAVATHKYVRAIANRGAVLLVEEAGTQREVVFQ